MEKNTNKNGTTQKLTGKARSLANLTYKLTRKEQSKGGKASTPPKALIHRKWCKPNCKLFPCPFQPLSEKYNGKCALKEQKQHIQKQILNLFTKGEEGLIHELTRTISNISIKARAAGTLEAERKYHYDLLNYGKFVYGEKIRTKVDANVESKQNTITIEDLRRIVNRKEQAKGQGE